MRTMILAASALLALSPLQAGAQDAGTADTGDFAVETAQDLVDLCSADRSSELYAEALQFCAGFLSVQLRKTRIPHRNRSRTPSDIGADADVASRA